MKYNNLKAFEKHLQDAAPAHLAAFYLVISKDSYHRNQAVQQILKAYSPSDQGIQIFQNAVPQFLNECDAISLFSRRRCLVLGDVHELNKSELEKLDSLLTRTLKDTCIVFTAASISAASGFYKKCEKAGIILDLPEEKAWEKEKNLPVWLISRAGESGKKLDPYAAQGLVKQAGTDQSLLHQELEKLICYVGERNEITPTDVKAICSTVNVENIFQLSEALFRRDTATALRISKAILDDGTVILALLKQLRSQFETDFQVACMLAQGAAPADITQRFPYMRGTILDRHIQSARSYGMQKFKEGLLQIDAAELKAKNSFDPTLLNELLIFQLTA